MSHICLTEVLSDTLELPNFQNWSVKVKGDSSPLTAADLAANKVICDFLKERYPSIPM